MDAFLAAHQVGPGGRVIGVDMTDAMLDKARENARKIGATNVEFRKGQIEHLPIEDESVDAIISNCVINLSPEKSRVFGEAYRVLRPGGRMMISDLVLERPLPAQIIGAVDAYLGCVGGASLRAEYLETIEKAGLRRGARGARGPLRRCRVLEDPQVREAMERFDDQSRAGEELPGRRHQPRTSSPAGERCEDGAGESRHRRPARHRDRQRAPLRLPDRHRLRPPARPPGGLPGSSAGGDMGGRLDGSDGDRRGDRSAGGAGDGAGSRESSLPAP